jgi:hypothetical protein
LGKTIILVECHFVAANSERLLNSNRANRLRGFVAAFEVAHPKRPGGNGNQLRSVSPTLQAVAKNSRVWSSSG